jgi:hypothetical protein
VEAFEDELVVFEACGFSEAVVEDSKDQIVDAVGGESYGEEVACGEGGEDRDEDL